MKKQKPEPQIAQIAQIEEKAETTEMGLSTNPVSSFDSPPSVRKLRLVLVLVLVLDFLLFLFLKLFPKLRQI